MLPPPHLRGFIAIIAAEVARQIEAEEREARAARQAEDQRRRASEDRHAEVRGP